MPGNHDVWLKEEDDVRKILLKHVSDKYPTLSDSIFSTIVTTQSNYAEFIKKINEDESYKPALLSTFDDTVGDYHLRFNLYNTAWMCGIKDQPGTIFMPTGSVKKPKKETDLVISVMHHSYNWLAIEKQNKTNFMRQVGSSSNILLYGHEHEVVATGKTDNITKGFISEY